MGGVMEEYHYVGHIYHGHVIFEGKVRMDDHFLVLDEYMRPPMLNFPSHDIKYCLLMSLSTGAQHEVPASRLRCGPHYKRVA